jgi:hypothetical protein
VKPNGFGIHPACTDEFVAWCADVIELLRRDQEGMAAPPP